MIDFYFERHENGIVDCRVNIDEIGFELHLWSDNAQSPRRWELEEVEILYDNNFAVLTFSGRAETIIKGGGKLEQTIDREFHKWVADEQD